MSSEAELAVRRLLFLWNARRIDRYHTDVCGKGFVLHRSDGIDETAEMLEASAARLVAAFPDIHTTADEIVRADEWVGARVTVRGTPEDAVFGDAPTGQPFVAEALVVYVVEDGKIAEEWTAPDFEPLFAMLARGTNGPVASSAPAASERWRSARTFVNEWRAGRFIPSTARPQSDFQKDMLPLAHGR
jgi:predicted ester cyclase